MVRVLMLAPPRTLPQSAAALAPRRPPPPPPSAPPAAADEDCLLPVDNLASTFVAAMFHEADADGDGRVADTEARAFFLRTGLAPAELSTIWRVVKPAALVAHHGKGLSKRRFSQALRLVALVQSGRPLTPELAAAAVDPGAWAATGEAPLPAPHVDPAPLKPALPAGNPFGGGGVEPVEPQPDGPAPRIDDVTSGLEFLGIRQSPAKAAAAAAAAEEEQERGAAFGPVGAPPTVGADDDIFNLAALQARASATAESPVAAAAESPSGGAPARRPPSLMHAKAMTRTIHEIRGGRQVVTSKPF